MARRRGHRSACASAADGILAATADGGVGGVRLERAGEHAGGEGGRAEQGAATSDRGYEQHRCLGHCLPLTLELTSLKYYLLSYRDGDIVQEHATDRLLRDLVAAGRPCRMTVTLDYKVRGGRHTMTTAAHAPDAPVTA